MRIVERRGDQIYVERQDPWSGETYHEWEVSPVQLCACGKKEIDQCSEVRVSTFTETYSCGYVFHYANHNGYTDKLISENGNLNK